ncbi:MAG: hypothetical protein H0T46_00225 [Deltaproteobacteria bacterium]|nr:hypothetical protein [Deltaproteobacteria bacterium]
MGRTTPAVLGVTFLCSCAQLAGIEETSSGSPDRVTLTVERVSIGATVVRAPMDLSGLAAQYLVPDDAEPDGLRRVDTELLQPDTWSAAIKSPAAPPVVFDLPTDPAVSRHQYDFDLRNLYTLFSRLEHPNPEPAPMGAMLTVRSMLPTPYAATESFQLYTLGSWNIRGFSGAELPVVGDMVFGPQAFAFSSMSSITGRPLEKITTADAVMFLRYLGSRLTGVMEAAPFDQTGTDTITGTLTNVPADQQLKVMLGPPAAVAARFAPARPAVPNLSMSWTLRAAPGYEIGNDNGPMLHQAPVVMADSGAVDVMYGNPFVSKGWPTVLTWSASASRSYTPAGQALPVGLNAGLAQIVQPMTDQVLDLPAGLPEVISIDNRPLSSDGAMIPKPTLPVRVTFASSITSNTLYQVTLYQLVPNAAGTALVPKHILGTTGLEPDFTLPPELFMPGTLYMLRATCLQGGHPDAADGDLRARGLPLSYGYLDSGVFSVMP